MITGRFGVMMDLQRGTMRRWYARRDGVKRWADNDQPCEADKKADSPPLLSAPEAATAIQRRAQP